MRARLPLRLGLLAASLVLVGGARRQDPGTPPPPQPAFGEHVRVAWVEVPVVVRRGSRRVRSLSKAAFRLYVDGREIRFETFDRGGDRPVSLVFLQDVSGSMALGGHLELGRLAVRWFLDHATPGDRFAIVTFAGGRASVEVPLTDRLEVLREAIGLWRAHGTTALHDAVAWLPRLRSGRGAGPQAVVLVTDGADNASVAAAATSRDRVREARLPVYVLGLDAGSPYLVDRDGRKLHPRSDLLNLLAFHSGGQYHPVEGAPSVAAACRAIAEDVRFQYRLGFATDPTGPDGFHVVEVVVRRRGVDLAFRRGYHGRPPR